MEEGKAEELAPLVRHVQSIERSVKNIERAILAKHGGGVVP